MINVGAGMSVEICHFDVDHSLFMFANSQLKSEKVRTYDDNRSKYFADEFNATGFLCFKIIFLFKF